MNKCRKIIRIVDKIVNLLIAICFFPILCYGLYGVWDSQQINQQADTSLYEIYKPSENDEMSFQELKSINQDVFGWLTIEGTHIDYPLVQGTDNSRYVNTNVKGEFSLSGSLFLDCRNKQDFSNINNVIYGHHMEKKAMFGELENFSEQSYFSYHQTGKIFDGNSWHTIEFFAFLEADAYDSILYNVSLQNGDRQIYLDYVKEHAKIFSELQFGEEDRYIVLSTCTSSSTNGRHLLVGRIGKNDVNGKEE